jgi:hypothetical protein
MGKPIIRIHPAIGIARLGNSLESFVGPEIPGVYPSTKIYRDEQGRLKRQAARFRLFLYDGAAPREITLKDVKNITWTVHLKNSKAAAPRCSGVLKTRSTLRNAKVKDRKSLILDARPRTIGGANSTVEGFCSRRFMGCLFPKQLKLCTLRTDADGRLWVLGGHGKAGSLTGAGLHEDNGNDFANHDGWYDDTSDGSVEAMVTLKNNSRIRARSSWVIVAPPKYAPALQSVTTLYDTLYQVAIDQKREPDPFDRKGNVLFRPSFRKDIYPILRRASELRWVFSKMAVAHEHQFAVTEARTNPAYRAHVFRQFRKPSGSVRKPGSGVGTMPYIWSDLFPYPTNGSVTSHQYKILEAWAGGRFEDDWETNPRVSKLCTPDGLDRAALEACVGAAFYPGIECSFHMRDKFRYKDLFRLDHTNLNPGDVTAQMSIPWQSDFVDCSDGDEPFVWWPAQRPIDVMLPNQPERYPTVRWARGFSGSGRDLTAIGMVRHWHRLGLIAHDRGRFVETDRVEKVSRGRGVDKDLPRPKM